MKSKHLLFGSVCTAVLCGSASAQDTTIRKSPVNEAAQSADHNTSKQAAISPQQLATCLAIDNQEEVSLARFAQDKAKDSKVKQFAKMLVEEHQEYLKNLSKWVPEATQENFLQETSAQPNATRGGATTTSTKLGTPSSQPSGQDQTAAGVRNNIAIATPSMVGDFTQLHREMALQCLSDTKKRLGQEEGAKFDVCFVGMQIAMHGAMHSKLTVLQKHTTGELQQVVARGLETTDKHMKEAEMLMKDIESDYHNNLKVSENDTSKSSSRSDN